MMRRTDQRRELVGNVAVDFTELHQEIYPPNTNITGTILSKCVQVGGASFTLMLQGNLLMKHSTADIKKKKVDEMVITRIT